MIRDDTRAVSIAITHALTLAITAVLISGLLIGAGQLLDRQEDRVAREQFSEIGGDMLSHINSLDRLDSTGDQVNVTLEPSYPGQVVGDSYTINITDDKSSHPFETSYALVISSDLLDQPKQYPLEPTGDTDLDETARVRGGDVLVCLRNDEISMGANCT